MLFLNRSYWPDAEATGQLLTELCEDLAEVFDVAVLCGQPNQNPANIPFKKSGVEQHLGVEVHRVFNLTFNKASLIGRGMNILSYLTTSTFKALFIRRPDVVVVETDPPLLCFLGVFLRWWFGAKLVVYLQDIYPDVALKLGKMREGFIYRLLHKLMHRAYRRADLVVVLSEDMRDLLLSTGVPSARISIVPNWIDTQLVHPVKQENPFRERNGIGDSFLVMYSGNLGLSQRLEILLEAAGLLRDEPKIKFYLVGAGATRDSLVADAQRRNLPNVQFLGYQPKEDLAASLSAADLHYVVLDPGVAGCLMPSKIYGIFAAGTPLLAATSNQCELARVVRENDIGYVVAFGDAEAIAERIEWASRHQEDLMEMGDRARQLAVEQYDRSYITRKFGELLLALTCSHPVIAHRAG